MLYHKNWTNKKYTRIAACDRLFVVNHNVRLSYLLSVASFHFFIIPSFFFYYYYYTFWLLRRCSCLSITAISFSLPFATSACVHAWCVWCVCEFVLWNNFIFLLLLLLFLSVLYLWVKWLIWYRNFSLNYMALFGWTHTTNMHKSNWFLSNILNYVGCCSLLSLALLLIQEFLIIFSLIR